VYVGKEPENKLTFHPTPPDDADFDQECTSKEVQLLQDTIHATNRRHLKRNDDDDKDDDENENNNRNIIDSGSAIDEESSHCQKKCQYWKRGYCFMFFCNDKDILQEEQEDQLVEISMQHCVSEFVAVNNAMNAVLPLLSESCQHVLAGGRDVTCYEREWGRRRQS
jgi:hypothetical protein